jgi:RimJ/RimL family protein N-acetyltransferase
MQTITPIIETDRLKLRGHRLDDFAASVAMWTDPNVTRYTTGQSSTEQQTWFRMLRYAGHWCLLGYGYWAVEEKASGAYIGELGFADNKRDIEAIQGLPELGWALVSSAHGKGYATEALRAALRWGDEFLASRRTACIIHPDNPASLRVADKLGYVQAGHVTSGGADSIIFYRTTNP